VPNCTWPLLHLHDDTSGHQTPSVRRGRRGGRVHVMEGRILLPPTWIRPSHPGIRSIMGRGRAFTGATSSPINSSTVTSQHSMFDTCHRDSTKSYRLPLPALPHSTARSLRSSRSHAFNISHNSTHKPGYCFSGITPGVDLVILCSLFGLYTPPRGCTPTVGGNAVGLHVAIRVHNAGMRDLSIWGCNGFIVLPRLVLRLTVRNKRAYVYGAIALFS
jgi:hypothetical protein